MSYSKVRIIHQEQEFYLVDHRRTNVGRLITFLRRATEKDAGAKPELKIKTDLGECVTVASWSEGRLRVEKGSEALKDTFQSLLTRYLEEDRVGRKRAGSKEYFFLSSNKQPVFSLTSAQPGGLSILVFTDEEQARRSAEERQGIDSVPLEVERLENLADFLTARAAEGFVGATLDNRDPVYVVTDDEGTVRFLRLSLDEGGELEQYLLEQDGTWRVYEWDENLVVDVDQDNVDRNMVECLGDLPYLGYHDHQTLYALAPRGGDGVPVALQPSGEDSPNEGKPYYPIFHDVGLAEDFLDVNGIDDLELVEVSDLRDFVRSAHNEGLPVFLQPDSHRARGGVLWFHEQRIILDGYSGLWYSPDGQVFQKH